MLMHKTFEIKVLERRKDGGRILINTDSVDRDRDRVLPSGVKLENYSRNPVVQWGHNYREPWSTIGKTNALNVSPEGIVADFDLRPAANEQDPQNIVRLLWEGNWIRTASIGFVPITAKPNEAGGKDFSEWELLEWSLVPIPSNQDALRLAVKGLAEEGNPLWPLPHQKEPAAQQSAWVRALSVETSLGAQDLLVMFRRHTLDIPADATVMQIDPFTGECNDVPHPDAGKTLAFKDVLFAPPLEFENSESERDGVYVLSGREAPDEDMVKHEMWTVKSLSDVLASVTPSPEAVGKVWAWDSAGFGVDVLTQTGIERALKAVRIAQRRGKTLLTKRGRVLSAKNEEKIRAARDNLDEVLAQLDEQPADDEKAIMGRLGKQMSDTEHIREAMSDMDSAREHCQEALDMMEEGKGLSLKPFPNEHACRLRDPNDFQADSFRRVEREHEGKRYAVILGRLKGETTLTEQAFRYPREVWTESEARRHCKSHDGIEFSPATGKADDEFDPDSEVSKDELESGIITKFSGSPRNPFGTHSSYQFKDGSAGYKRAWRLHFSQINGGSTSGAATGPIRGTVRRTEMIGATMGCNLPSTDSVAARDGPPSPLEGSFPEHPGDYGLDKWKEPETDADREGVKFSCPDLAIIKRAALAEIKRRAEDREHEEDKSIPHPGVPAAIEASSDETDSPAPFDERELAELLTQFVQTAKEALT